jgi:tetratricopeptide (TPR) repeat protein
MAMMKFRSVLTFLCVAGAATILVIEHQTQEKLRAEGQALRQEVAELRADNESLSNRLAVAKVMRAPRLPAPALQFAAAPVERPPDKTPGTNLFAGFPGLKAKAPNRLSAGKLEAYLKEKGRSAASLLTAYRTTGDPALLQEAVQRFGKEPRVALEAALRKGATPEERRQSLEELKQSDPGNGLPNYLSALDYFKAGQTDRAVEELVAASGKQQFEDYAAHRAQENEEAYLAAGYSVAEARAIAPLQQALDFAVRDAEAVGAVFPVYEQQTEQLGQMKALFQNMVELAKAYQQSGDAESARAALQMVANLAQRYSNAPGADGLNQLFGRAAEVLALSHMDPNSAYGSNGQTVQDRINQLRQDRPVIKGLYQQAAPLLGMLTEQDWAGYSDRARTFGEPAALQWVLGKYGQK